MRDYDSLYTQLLSDLGTSPDFANSHNSDCSVEAVAKQALAASFYKKLCPEGNSESADANALKKFLALNAAIPATPFDFAAENEAEACFWDYFRNEVAQMTDQHVFGRSFDMEFIRDHMGPGPGAAQKADSQDMITKLFSGQMSYYSEDSIRLYRGALSTGGVWAEAEMQRFQTYGFVRVEGCAIFFAPKNKEISRTCGTEANLEVLIQKAIGAFLEQGLEADTGISLSTQPALNRELARLGSECWEDLDPFCTTDLISASDCIRKTLVDVVIVNPVLRHAMMASRAKLAVLPDGKRVNLNMMSTMGNGFTFPLQTLIFASAVKAVYQLMGIPLVVNGMRNYGVFGDDIVVRKRANVFLNRMLTKLGFQVNEEKSFSSGPFRESCGHDYFKGRNVRGVYVKTLETHPEICSVINRLHRWSSWHGIRFSSVTSTLLEWISYKPLVPPSESDDSGVHVPFELTRPKLSAEYWFKYRALRRVIKRVEIKEIDENVPDHSDLGIACGFLSGTYRRRDISYLTEDDVCSSPWEWDWSASVTLRDLIGVKARYQIVAKTIPYWDYVMPEPWLQHDGTSTKKGAIPVQNGPWRVGSDTVSYTAWRQAVASSFRR